MSRIIPFMFALISPVLFGGPVGCTYRAATLDDVPTPGNPLVDIPEVRAWYGHTPLTMGVDSACSLPVVAFPELAALCGRLGPVRNGFHTAPLGVSLVRGREPVVAYSHVVTAGGTPLQGLIGWPVIRNYVWHLDPVSHGHYFHRTLPPEVEGWKSLPLLKRGVSSVDLPGCGVCILDTGAPYGLYLSEKEWQRFLRDCPEAEVGLYRGESPAAGGSFVRRYAWVRSIRLGPWELHNIRVCESFSKLTGPRLLGRESLAQMDLWLDGPNSRLYYKELQGAGRR